MLEYEELMGHIGPECRLFAVKSTSAETGMGVTTRSYRTRPIKF